jgi:non-ribosomal peptide synthetase component E (peptide arylation enzyme)
LAAGLSRAQLGITDAMLETYGDLVFQLSNNLQTRRGDPVRRLEFDVIDAERGALGMSDAQIADRIGLSEAQVTYIRNYAETRRMRVNNFQRLLDLGGGRRHREERFTPHEQRFAYSPAALELRAALTFDGELTTRYARSGWWAGDTLSSWLARWSATAPDNPALLAAEETLSYAVLQARVDRLASALYRLGVAPGEVVAVQLPNVAEYVIVYLALARLGAVLSTLYMPHRAAELQTLLAHSRCYAFVCVAASGDFSPPETALELQAGGALPDLQHIIVAGQAPAGTHALSELLQDESGTLPPTPVAADPLLLLYTSGTTAAPKGVPHNSHTVLSNARAGADEHGLHSDDVILSAPPFGHLYGLYTLHLALCSGAATLLLPAFTPPALTALISQARPTALFAAPAQLIACLQSDAFDTHALDSLRLIVLSGNAVPARLIEQLAARLPDTALTQLWGMTETQAGTYTRPGDPPGLAARSAGRPSPGTEARVVGERGQVLASDTEGELQVRGPLLFPGYLRNDAANRASFTADGWFRTGDIASIDTQGNVAINGRLKDLINRGGVKYNPRDVEELLDAHPAVQQSAIVPFADPVLGERACCFTVLHPQHKVTLEELCTYLLDCGIGKTRLPERLQIVAEMPLTPTRKVIKSRLVVENPALHNTITGH